jgi:hypothetical protein
MMKSLFCLGYQALLCLRWEMAGHARDSSSEMALRASLLNIPRRSKQAISESVS